MPGLAIEVLVAAGADWEAVINENGISKEARELMLVQPRVKRKRLMYDVSENDADRRTPKI